jgi:hypothetical protein
MALPAHSEDSRTRARLYVELLVETHRNAHDLPALAALLLSALPIVRTSTRPRDQQRLPSTKERRLRSADDVYAGPRTAELHF